MIKFKSLEIPDVILVEPELHIDNRGFFLETLRESYLDKFKIKKFVQHNHSRSFGSVLRGLHYQSKKPQGKLVRCSYGEIFDVAVDIRMNSPFFAKWIGVKLDDKKHKQLWIPPGFAHGFLVLSEIADVCYSCSEYYIPEKEVGITWNDKDIGIEWPLDFINSDLLISSKDKKNPILREINQELLLEYRKSIT